MKKPLDGKMPRVTLPRPTLEKKAGTRGGFTKENPRPGPGRTKGVPNKVTVSVRAALTEAFEQMGGVTSLVRWGRLNQSDFYKLWTRLLPIQITGNDGGPVQVVTTKHDLSKLSIEELTTLANLVDKVSMARAEAGQTVPGGVSIRLKKAPGGTE